LYAESPDSPDVSEGAHNDHMENLPDADGRQAAQPEQVEVEIEPAENGH